MAAAERTFHKKLYALAAIKDAMAQYGPFATLEMATGDEGWTVTFDEVDEEIPAEVLASEFANFVLAGTIQSKR